MHIEGLSMRVAALPSLLLLLTLPALALDPVSTGRFGNVAVGGYDPVTYFEESEPVKGEKSISHEWNGAVWRFASTENLERFVADPEAYAPQYGGYCAFAVSKGYTAPSDPKAWAVWEGKLYLNYNKNVREKWQTDVPGNVAKANENWPGLLAD